MGIIKTVAKVVGTVALGATGTASTVLKGVADATGVELASEILGAAKDASFNGIRSMWDSDTAQNNISVAEEKSYDVEDASRRSAANTAYRAAQIAKKNGDMEKYEQYMDVYYQNK